MSSSSFGLCVVDGVFDHAALDRVMHVKVNGSFGACSCADEHVVQLDTIGEYSPLYAGRFGLVDNVVGRINKVDRHRTQLVFGWVTIGRWVSHLCM